MSLRMRIGIQSSLFAFMVAVAGCNSAAPGSVSINSTPGSGDMGMSSTPGTPGTPGTSGGSVGDMGSSGRGGSADLGSAPIGPVYPGNPVGPQPDMLGAGDMAQPIAGDDTGDGGPPAKLGDGGVFMPPPPNADMATPPHGPPVTKGSFTTYATGVAFNDVSTEEGGGIWGANNDAVYYFTKGKTFTYNQSNGLASGKTTWTDTYWFGTPSAPSTQKVSFQSVAGGAPGQVAIGIIGYTLNRLDVDPTTGAVRDVVGVAVSYPTQNSDQTEAQEQAVREVASWKVALDLNGPMGGSAYMGGFHGTSTLHNFNSSRTTGICSLNCYDYEEHIHPFSNDETETYGGDVHAIAVTAAGDLWIGDRKAIYFVPEGSRGANADFFPNPLTSIPGQPGAAYINAFPGATNGDEWNWGIAVDKAGGLYVASYGNGLVYLTANSYSPTYFSASNKLPENSLTGVAIDSTGDVWIGTHASGVARYTPSTGAWLYYTEASGLPSNDIAAVWYDKYGSPGGVYFATDNGIAVYK